MHSANSIRQGEIIALIAKRPGITKQEILAMLDMSLKALEQHLTRIVNTERAYSVDIPGCKKRGWYAGRRPEVQVRRIGSVFDLAEAA